MESEEKKNSKKFVTEPGSLEIGVSNEESGSLSNRAIQIATPKTIHFTGTEIRNVIGLSEICRRIHARLVAEGYTLEKIPVSELSTSSTSQ